MYHQRTLYLLTILKLANNPIYVSWMREHWEMTKQEVSRSLVKTDVSSAKSWEFSFDSLQSQFLCQKQLAFSSKVPDAPAELVSI